MSFQEKSEFKQSNELNGSVMNKVDYHSDASHSDWRALCQLVQTASQSWKVAIDRDDEETETESDMAMNQLCEVSQTLSHCKANNLEEVSVKINLWRLLAPEEATATDSEMPDTNLLVSLLDDIERLAQRA